MATEQEELRLTVTSINKAPALIAAEREFIIEVVGRALGKFRDELFDEIEKMIAEEIGKLGTEVNTKRESSDGEVVLLP